MTRGPGRGRGGGLDQRQDNATGRHRIFLPSEAAQRPLRRVTQRVSSQEHPAEAGYKEKPESGLRIRSERDFALSCRSGASLALEGKLDSFEGAEHGAW